MKKPRNLIIIAIIIVVLVAAGVAAMLVWNNYQSAHKNGSGTSGSNGSNSSSNGGQGGALTPTQVAQKTADDAQKLAYSSGTSAGVKALNDAIQNTNDTSQQFIYYSQLATLLLNNNQLPDALTAAKKAYSLNQVSESAALVGQIAQQMGDKPTAIQYYNYAIARIDPNDIYAQSDKTYYQGIVAGLQGGQ